MGHHSYHQLVGLICYSICSCVLDFARIDYLLHTAKVLLVVVRDVMKQGHLLVWTYANEEVL